MKKFFNMFFCFTVFFIFFQCTANANITPLKVKNDGVEPIENPGVKIDTANIIVTPDKNYFTFKCSYVLEALKDVNNLIIGIPGDLGYSLEAGYISDMNISVNTKDINYKEYRTTTHPSERWKDQSSLFNFKWYTFPISVKKNSSTHISVSYNISWRILEQKNEYPYFIIPFLLSTDKLFSSGFNEYTITYVNDDYISIPDVKVMVNSVLGQNTISDGVMSPTWSSNQIQWKFKTLNDLQNFRLIVLSDKKLAAEFSAGASVDSSIRWALLNNNYDKLSELFEDIALKKIDRGLSDYDLGTAAYLSAEYYCRTKEYDKALKMLGLRYQTAIWPTSVKRDYINILKLMEDKKYTELFDELKKLSQYKEYVLVSNYASNELTFLYNKLTNNEITLDTVKDAPEEEKSHSPVSVYYLLPLAGVVIIFIVYNIIYRYRKR